MSKTVNAVVYSDRNEAAELAKQIQEREVTP
jgi:hypothetical protein